MTPSAVSLEASLPLSEEAAAAVRRKDFEAARRHLLAPRNGGGVPARNVDLVLGLYAHACELPARAIASLGDERKASAALEDWRLWALADSARAAQQEDLAQRALLRILADHRDSPLRPRALLEAADLAFRREDHLRALELIGTARGSEMPAEVASALETLAWEIGLATGSRPLQEKAGRRLLAHHPTVAEELKVTAILRAGAAGDELDLLSDPELKVRSRSLLAVDDFGPALAALEAVSGPGRDLDWHLLRAEALTRDRRGAEAWKELGPLSASAPAEQAALDWRRALAALDASQVRRGRRNLPAAERREMAAHARRHLQRVSQIDAERETTLAALRLLFTELAEEDKLDQALSVLRSLRRLDPSDTTGARHLWRLGWSQYESRNGSGAIGHWSELQGLYPESRYARSAVYWSARAHERLGSRERAMSIYEQIVAVDVTDFYRFHALERLGRSEEPPIAAPSRPTEPWPRDPVLERARLLSDLGLDELALAEADALAGHAEPQAYHALKARILARLGSRRESIISLRRAFPALGTPGQSALPEEALRLYYPLDYGGTVVRYARDQGLSPHLVLGMIRQESAFDPAATSWAGARGLMQLMPTTGRELARRLGLRYSSDRLSDPEFSIRLGTSYFRQVLGMFGENEQLALAGYNAGPYRIKRLWTRAGSRAELDTFLEGLTLEETKSYVKRVLLFSDSYRRFYGESLVPVEPPLEGHTAPLRASS